MTTPIRSSTTAAVDIDTAYDSSISFGVAAGLYIGDAGDASYLLLWFEGDTAADQCEAIDRAIDALAALKREARAATAPVVGRRRVSLPTTSSPAPMAAGVDADDIPF